MHKKASIHSHNGHMIHSIIATNNHTERRIKNYPHYLKNRQQRKEKGGTQSSEYQTWG